MTVSANERHIPAFIEPQFTASKPGAEHFPWQDDPAVSPLFHHQLVIDNRGNKKAQDQVTTHLIAALISKVRAEQAGSESLTNVCQLLRKAEVPAEQTSYLTYRYVREPIPLIHPKQPCRVRQLFGAARLPAFTQTGVVVAQSDQAVDNLLAFDGTPALDVPLARTALIVTIPSSDANWSQARQVEEAVLERLHHREQHDPNRLGPYFGQYRPDERNRDEPVLAILFGRIADGLEAIRQLVESE